MKVGLCVLLRTPCLLAGLLIPKGSSFDKNFHLEDNTDYGIKTQTTSLGIKALQVT